VQHESPEVRSGLSTVITEREVVRTDTSASRAVTWAMIRSRVCCAIGSVVTIDDLSGYDVVASAVTAEDAGGPELS
jgi:hypothetical protein